MEIIWGIDLDEVGCSLMQGFINHFGGQIAGVLCTIEDIEHYHIYKNPKFNLSVERAIKLFNVFYNSQSFNNLSVCEGFPEFLDRLDQQGHGRHIITGRTSEWEDKTISWLEKNDLFHRLHGVHFASTYGANPVSKSELIKLLKITHFVDDDPFYCNEIAQNSNCEIHIITKPWNKDAELHPNIIRIDSLDEIKL